MDKYSEGSSASIIGEIVDDAERLIMGMAADEALDAMIGQITERDLEEIMDHTLEMTKIASNTTWINAIAKLLDLRLKISLQQQALELRTMEKLDEDPLAVMLRKEIEKQRATLPQYSRAIEDEMKGYKKGYKSNGA